MKKIPTLFVRDFSRDNGRYVLTDQTTPGTEWVSRGEGIATRKYDGTCVLIDGAGNVWSRREVKADKPAPVGFMEVSWDPTTHKRMGWEPAAQSGFAAYIEEALSNEWDGSGLPEALGTYELCGPKINGNPEHFDRHVLVPHAEADQLGAGAWDDLIAYCREHTWEGVVWHHPDGRMAKLKVKDIRP